MQLQFTQLRSFSIQVTLLLALVLYLARPVYSSPIEDTGKKHALLGGRGSSTAHEASYKNGDYIKFKSDMSPVYYIHGIIVDNNKTENGVKYLHVATLYNHNGGNKARVAINYTINALFMLLPKTSALNYIDLRGELVDPHPTDDFYNIQVITPKLVDGELLMDLQSIVLYNVTAVVPEGKPPQPPTRPSRGSGASRPDPTIMPQPGPVFPTEYTLRNGRSSRNLWD